MRNVIVAFDGKHFSEGVFDFLCNLNNKEPILATGFFLPEVDFAELLYSIGGLGGPIYYKEFAFEDTTIVQKNIDLFKSLCRNNGIKYYVQPDIGKHIISELESESRYADMLVLSSKLFYENLDDDTWGNHIEDVLHRAECPVILIHGHYNNPKSVILAYDGSASSVHAIKQFAYLLPELTKFKTLLVTAGGKNDGVPDIKNIGELAACHFSDLTIFELGLNPGKYFNTWLQDNGSSILVTGAYGRSALSEMLKKSFIAETIQDHKVPIFIAHR